MEELKLCPFCGCDKFDVQFKERDGGFIYCKNCPAGVEEYDADCDNIELFLVRAWNARADESAYQRGLNDGRREGFVGGAWCETKYRFGEHADEIDYEVVSKRAEAEANHRWPKINPVAGVE